MKISLSAGPLSVFVGAITYGMPGVILSLATRKGSQIESLLTTQFLFSFVLFFDLSEIIPRREGDFKRYEKTLVLTTGIPLMCVTLFFYNAIYYIGVATSTLLVMQSAWIAPALNSLIRKKPIKNQEKINIFLIMLGVLIATGAFSGKFNMNMMGLIWGMLSSLSYSLVIISSSNVANGVRIIDKAKLLTFGAFIASLFTFNSHISISLVSMNTTWSIVNAMFSSILPVFLYGFGMPRTSSSLSGMLVTTELPAAFIFSHILLDEEITNDQILGCTLIVISLIIPVLVKRIKWK